MKMGPDRRRKVLLAAAALLFASWASAASAQPYKLAPGDVLQLSVVGFPEMKQRSPINVDGEIMLPLVGNMKASGMTITELSAAVKSRFANKVMQQRTPDGRAGSIVLAPDEVTLDVLEYRPVYLRGDVSKPGEQSFRPGMTVRQAIAVAGGYDLVRFRTGNPVQESASLRGEAASLWNELLRQTAVAWRLHSEIGDTTNIPQDRALFEKSPLAPEVIDAAFKTEADSLASRRLERDREANYLTNVITQSDRRISLLSEQQKNEEEGAKQDAEDFDRVSKLFEKGNTSITRYSDSRRAMLLSATRILQTSAAVAQVEREREELRKTLANLNEKRKIEALKDLQEAETKLNQSKAKLAATQEQLLYSGKMRTQLGIGLDQNVELAIIRQSDKGRQRILAQEDTELLPGDSVEVALDSSQLLTLRN